MLIRGATLGRIQSLLSTSLPQIFYSTSGTFHYLELQLIDCVINSAYPSLVQSLLAIFSQCGTVEFLMAWNRRISESGTFFQMMKEAGFRCHHHGKCVYSFYRNESADEYLLALPQFDHSNM